jgi:hypothetical protein
MILAACSRAPSPAPRAARPKPSTMPVALRRATRRTSAAGAILTAILYAIASFAFAAQAQPVHFAPIDENATDLAWLGYRNRLVEALEARNRTALLAAIAADIDNGPDQKRGLDEFRRRWDFDDDRSPMWDELRKAVTLGGAYVKSDKGNTRYCTPYVAARWPTDIDPFAFGAIVAADVLVKVEPSSESRTMATLTHEVVQVEDWEVTDKTPGFPQKWTRIAVQGNSGYVPEQQIRSPIEHMACFAVQGGQWRLVSFTAGYLPE